MSGMNEAIKLDYWECGCGNDGRSCGCSEFWKDIREAGKEKHRKWRDETANVIDSKLIKLKNLGFQIKNLTPYQIRINNQLDIYWQSQRYHDVKKNKRGNYDNLEKFIQKYFK